jgi:hypothetical protein
MLVRDTLITRGWKKNVPKVVSNIDVTDQNLIIHRFYSLLLKAEVIVADQAIEKFYAVTGREEWEYEKHYDCVLPPFSLFFLETKKPSLIRSSIAFDDASSLSNSWGVLFQEISLNSGFSESEMARIFSNFGLKYLQGYWLYTLNFVFEEPNRKVTFGIPEVTAFFLIDKKGKIIRNPIFMFHQKWKLLPQSSIESMEQVVANFSASAFYCLDLLNSLQWKLEKKYTSSGILGNVAGCLTHYNLLVPY